MKINSGRFLLVTTLLLSVYTVSAQNQSTSLKKILSADSSASGNFKDILTNFYQLAMKNLIGDKKEINFNSNPYAILLKSNPNLAIDTNYRKYRILRKLNFGIGLNLNDAYRFNGFSSGIKYALINNRDSTTSKWLLMAALKEDSEYTVLSQSLIKYAHDSLPATQRKAFVEKVNLLFNDVTITFEKFDFQFQRTVKKIAFAHKLTRFLTLINTAPNTNIHAAEYAGFDKLKQSLQNKFLWTIGVSDTTYKDQFFFSNLLFSTEALKGILHPTAATNVELDLKASLNIINDTLYRNRNLHRSIFSFQPGVNWVIKNKQSQLSFFELKFSGGYDHIISGLYLNEKRDQVNFSGTIRLRITNEFWIPLQFKYDPINRRVLGFLNITTNFTGIKKPNDQ